MSEDLDNLSKRLIETKAKIEKSITDSVTMYAVVDVDKPYYELMNIPFESNDSTDEFDRTLFSNGLEPFIQEDALSHVNDAIEDENKKAIIPLDWLSENGEDASKISNLIAQVSNSMHGQKECSDLRKDEISDVRGVVFIYCSGNDRVIAYQRIQNAWIAKKTGIFIWEGRGFNLYTNESLKIGNTFDFLIYDDNLIVSKFGTLESQFGFTAVLQQKATGVVNKLVPVMEDPNNYLSEKIEDGDASIMKKLVKIDALPIMGLIRKNPKLLSEKAEAIDEYKDNINFENGKVIIKYKKDIGPFLKMLNDQYLVSPLSGEKYESQNKRWIRKSELTAEK